MSLKRHNYLSLMLVLVMLFATLTMADTSGTRAQADDEGGDGLVEPSSEPIMPSATPMPTEVPPTLTPTPTTVPPTLTPTTVPPTATPTVVPPTSVPATTQPETTPEAQPEAPTNTPTNTLTEEPVAPEATAEPTSEPQPEVTPEVPEVTEEPAPIQATQEATAEPVTPEATAEPTSEPQPEGTPITEREALSESFEAFAGADWTVIGWLPAQDATSDNGFLYTLAPEASAQPLGVNWAHLELNARLRVAANNTLSILFRDVSNPYRVMFDALGRSRLYRGDTLLASTSAAPEGIAAGDWFDVQVRVNAQQITLSVNGVGQIAVNDATWNAGGPVVFQTGSTNAGEVALDALQMRALEPQPVTPEPTPIVVTAEATPEASPELTAEPAPETNTSDDGLLQESDGAAVAPEESPVLVPPAPEVTPERTAEAQPNPTDATPEAPIALSEADLQGLSGPLQRITQAQVVGDVATARDIIARYFMETNDAGALLLEISARNSLDALVASVEAHGVTLVRRQSYSVVAYVPLAALPALAQDAEVDAIYQPSRGASTGPLGAPIGGNATTGYDIHGLESWHRLGADGQAANGRRVIVGIIDTGFNPPNGFQTGANGDHRCLAGNTAMAYPSANDYGTSSHGVNVVEVICDLAPQSTHRMYRATDLASLGEALALARTQVDVIVVTLDLGVNASPGDGTVGGQDLGGAPNPYTEISNARNAGIPVIVAAGNSTGRYEAFNIDGATGDVTVEITATAGDLIKVSWNDWDGNLNGATPEDFTLTANFGTADNITTRPGGLPISTDYTVPCPTNQANCTGTLQIVADGGDAGNVVMQVQVMPVQVAGEQAWDGTTAIGPGQDQNVTIDAVTGALADGNAGTLGRPADAAAAFTVGAACASPTNNLPLLSYSSRGPVYATGGGFNPVLNTLDDIKPNLTGVAHVSTSLATLLSAQDCDGTLDGADRAGGFGGTSASAAHLAGMVAVLMSNDNASMDAFRVTNAIDATAVDALQSYLQGHATDLPLDETERPGWLTNGGAGFDRASGAGLSVLGAGDYDLSIAQATYPVPNATALTALGCNGDVLYVRQTNTTGQLAGAGTFNNPFPLIGEGLKRATANACVIVLPGEYMTPILVTGVADGVQLIAYDRLTGAANATSQIRAETLYRFPGGRGSVVVRNATNSFALRGFTFLQAPVRAQQTPNQALAITQSGPTTISDSTFDGYQNAAPLTVVNQNGLTVLRDNNFRNNAALNGVPAVLEITESGDENNRIVVMSNAIRDNQAYATDGQGDFARNFVWSTQVRIDNSYVDLINNAFVGNQGETLIQSRTYKTGFAEDNTALGDPARDLTDSSIVNPADDEWETRMVGNVLLNNSNLINDSDPGPMIHLYYNRRFYFINNTVVNNIVAPSGIASDEPTAFFGRGNEVPTDVQPFTPFVQGGGYLGSVPDGPWEIHNNLFYENTAEGLNDNFDIQNTTCRNIAGESANSAGMENNWFFDNNFDLGSGRNECAIDVNDQTKLFQHAGRRDADGQLLSDINGAQNVDVTGVFVGPNLQDLNADTDPTYYLQLGAENNGVDFGLPLSDLYDPDLDFAGFFDEDFRGEPRLSGTTIDIGAFEVKPIQVDPIAVSFTEDTNLPFEIPLSTEVEGGFGELQFEVADGNLPQVFGTQCPAPFNPVTNTSGVTIAASSGNPDEISAYYCPPPDFYTAHTTQLTADEKDLLGPDWPEAITFGFTVSDGLNAPAVGVVNVQIDPSPDTALNTPITHEVSGDINSPLLVNLRPRVSYSDASGFSLQFTEPGETDWPYQYTQDGLVNAGGVVDSVVFGPVDDGSATGCTGDGNLAHDQACVFFQGLAVGTATQFYTVTELIGDTSVANNQLIIRGTSRTPARGIFDDASFAFTYSGPVWDDSTDPYTLVTDVAPGNWNDAFNAASYNQSLHTSSTSGDTAKVTFKGEGFILYMQGGPNANAWEIIYENAGSPPTPVIGSDWTQVGDTAFYESTFNTASGTMTCQTTALPFEDVDNPGRLDNGTGAPYTVTCNGLDAGTHTFYLVNRSTGSYLGLDAFAILLVADAGTSDRLPAGTHDVTSREVRTAFANLTNPGDWQQTIIPGASNQVAYVNTVAQPEALIFGIEGATGFALQTTLEPGTSEVAYDLCLRIGGTTTESCQRFDNGARAGQNVVFNVFRPFFGLDPDQVYDVIVRNVTTNNGGRMVIDGLVVFPETMRPTSALPYGTTEDDQTNLITLGNGLPDAWLTYTGLNPNSFSGGSLTLLDSAQPSVGPFIGFEMPVDADAFTWERYDYGANLETSNVYICVDRLLGSPDGTYGNCVLVNLQTNNLRPIDADTPGATLDNQVVNLAQRGTVNVTEEMFRTDWGPGADGVHRVEIFAATEGQFGLDAINVVSRIAAVTAGLYQETSRNLRYYDVTLDEAGVATSVIERDAQPGTFPPQGTRITLIPSTAFSGGNAVYIPSTVAGLADESPTPAIYTRVLGTGFAPVFYRTTSVESYRVCWQAFDPQNPPDASVDVLDVLNNGTCQVYDEGGPTTVMAERPIRGLPRDHYAVAVQLLEDDGVPVTSAPAQSLWFDGFYVYDEADTLAQLTPLVPGRQYNFNYAQRQTQGRYHYFDTGWIYAPFANQGVIGDDIDYVANQGAGVMFRTQNANALTFYRYTAPSLGEVEICAIPVNAPDERRCDILGNTNTTVLSEPITFRLGESIQDYVVTLIAESSNFIIPDGLEVHAVGTLGAGSYNHINPAINYETGLRNVLTDGNFDLDPLSNWPTVGGAAAPTVIAAPWYAGTQILLVTAGENAGIQSQPITLEQGNTYTFYGRVYNVTPNGAIKMTDAAGLIGEARTTPGLVNAMQTLSIRYTHTGTDTTTRLQFLGAASGLNTQFYIDDVKALTGSDWEQVYYADTRTMQNAYPGSSVSFSFTGTGFEVTTYRSTLAGETEICYRPASAQFTDDQCFTYQDESTSNTFEGRTVTGLPRDTYQVTVSAADDGNSLFTNPPGLVRSPSFPHGKLILESVRIFDNASSPAVPAGDFNQDATQNGAPYLQLMGDWATYRDATASEGDYSAIADPATLNASNLPAAGAAATLHIDLSPVDVTNATVVIFPGPPTANASDQLLVCVGAVDGAVAVDGSAQVNDEDGTRECRLLDNLTMGQPIVLQASDFPLLDEANGDASQLVRPIFLTTLSRGNFTLDGFQVHYGTRFSQGFYEGEYYEQAGLTLGNANWALTSDATYSGGQAFTTSDDGASISFDFSGTGFGVRTQLGTNGSTFQLNIQQQNCTNCLQVSETIDTSAQASFLGWITYAGLPDGDYKVTLTDQSNGTGTVLDAIRIFGALNTLGSLYDDAQRDGDGALVLTYGPAADSWQTLSDAEALNQTYHASDDFGASVSFSLRDDVAIDGIAVWYLPDANASNAVQVCWTRSDVAPFGRDCSQTLDATQASGRASFDVPQALINLGGGNGSYHVSLTNQVNGAPFRLDAIQVLETGIMAEGIYQQDWAGLTDPGNDQAVTGASDGQAGQLANGESLEFTMSGMGVSIVLMESTSTASAYDLCITSQGGTDCDTVNLSLSNNATSGTASPFALTQVGLHGGVANATYTVRLSNTSAETLLFDRVEVLGSNRDLVINTSAKIENDAPQVRAFPFGSLTASTANSDQVSGGSQHTGTTRGALAYAEFINADGVEIARQLSGGFGQAQLCVGRVGEETLSEVVGSNACLIIDNTGNAFQVSANLTPVIDSQTCSQATNGCWVAVQALDSNTLPLDFLRTYSGTQPMTAGTYEESFPGLRRFNTGKIVDVADSLLPTSNLTGTSNGVVGDITTPGEGFVLNMQGTGFSVNFVRDTSAGEVRVCFLEGVNQAANDVLTTGYCHEYENNLNFTLIDAPRPELGLVPGTYTVAVEMLSGTSMKVDTIAIYDEDWYNDLDALRLDDTVNFNYNERVTEGNFFYYGDWQNVSAGGFTNNDLDLALNHGASVVFHVDGSNAIAFNRYVGITGRLRICGAPITSTSPLTVDHTQRVCRNSPGTSSSAGLFSDLTLFSTTYDANQDYVVTMTSIDWSDTYTWLPDDVTPLDAGNVMIAGTYESGDPSILTDLTYENLLPYGNMDGNLGLWQTSGLTVTQVGALYEGTGAFQINGNADALLSSSNVDLVANQSYTLVARVQAANATAQLEMQLRQPDGTVLASATSAQGNTDLQKVSLTYTPTGNENAQVAFRIINGGTLTLDDVTLNQGGAWEVIPYAGATGGTVLASSTHGATARFSFTGTGFGIAMPTDDARGGETQICYQLQGDQTQHCYTHQNEGWSQTGSVGTRRVVRHLPRGTYEVTIVDVEDGLSDAFGSVPRFATYNPVGRIYIDYVEIFDEAPPPLSTVGFYNDDAANGAGEAFIDLAPANNWQLYEDLSTSTYTAGTIHFTLSNGQVVTAPGSTLSMRYNVPANETVNLVISSGTAPYSGSPPAILACVDHVSEATCTTITNMPTQAAVSLTSVDPGDNAAQQESQGIYYLPGLAQPGERIVTLTTYLPGSVLLDDAQLLYGQALPPGQYTLFLGEDRIDFGQGQTFSGAGNDRNAGVCTNYLAEWCSATKYSPAYLGNIVYTGQRDRAFRFTVDGTGFGVSGDVNSAGGDLRICYRRSDSGQAFPGVDDPIVQGRIADGEVWCEVVTTNTADPEWSTKNNGAVNPGSGSQYTFAYYGLASGRYDVEVRVVDDTITSRRGYILLDSIHVYGEPPATLTDGLYEQDAYGVVYGGLSHWQDYVTAGTPSGAYDLSQALSFYNGALVQFRLEGNAFTLHQAPIAGANTSQIRVCLVDPGATGLHCSAESAIADGSAVADYDRSGITRNAPVVLYGLGEGEHDVVVENRHHNLWFSLDRIEIER